MNDSAGLLVRDGRVESVDGDTVVVRIAAAGACARCARGEGCGFGFASARAGDTRLLLARPEGFRPLPGDTVRVTLEPRGVTGAAGAVYGVPLAGLVAGSASAALLGLGDAAAVGIAICGFAAALPLARTLCRRMDAGGHCRPRLLPAGPAGAGADA